MSKAVSLLFLFLPPTPPRAVHSTSAGLGLLLPAWPDPPPPSPFLPRLPPPPEAVLVEVAAMASSVEVATRRWRLVLAEEVLPPTSFDRLV